MHIPPFFLPELIPNYMHVWQHPKFCQGMFVKEAVTEQMPRACVAHTLTAPDRKENVRK